jgi:hypothetical protein
MVGPVIPRSVSGRRAGKPGLSAFSGGARGYGQLMADVVEDGDIYFLYRPRVAQPEVTSLDEVQRLLVVLRPWRERRPLRLLVIGRKRLPEIRAHDRFWGFVDEVAEGPKALDGTLGGRVYQTKTRGERTQPAARPVAEGAYVIARHGDHTHLAYQLELPDRPGEPQRELNIEQEASYIISVKNPGLPSPPGTGRPRAAVEVGLPQELQNRFGARRFIPLEPPDFLDHPGVEFLLIAAAHDASEELGIDLDPYVEQASHATMLRDLRLDRRDRPVEPLFTGEWR